MFIESFSYKGQPLSKATKQKSRLRTTFRPLCLLTMLILPVSCNKSKDGNGFSLFTRESPLPYDNFTRFDWEGFNLEIDPGKQFTDPITLNVFSPTAPNNPLIWLKISGNSEGTNDSEFVWVPSLQSRFKPFEARSLLEWWKRSSKNPATNQHLNNTEKMLISNGSVKVFPINYIDIKLSRRPSPIPDSDYTSAVLPHSNFSGRNLQGVSFSYASLYGANFEGANLEWANMSGATLQEAKFEAANLTNAILARSNISNSNLKSAILKLANLNGCNVSFSNLGGAKLMGAILRETSFNGSDLRGADLTGADLTRANLTGANLTGADLTGANLTGARLRDANLTRANLTGAGLRGANLEDADILNANFTRADINGAIFRNVKNFGFNQLGPLWRCRVYY